MSFFLWSSIPDEELLTLAERGELQKSEILEQQTLRMLKDSRSKALVENFAGQWLQLRDLEHKRPDAEAFPDIDLDLARADLTLERRGTVPDERRPGTELERRVAEYAEDGVALSRFTHSGTCGPAEISEISNPLELSRTLSLLLLLVLASVLGR